MVSIVPFCSFLAACTPNRRTFSQNPSFFCSTLISFHLPVPFLIFAIVENDSEPLLPMLDVLGVR